MKAHHSAGMLTATATFTLIVFSALIGAHAWAAPTTVDCGAGDTIANALLVSNDLLIKGQCREDVEIVQDDVTLTGDLPSKGMVIGGILVNGARRVSIDTLRVRGKTDSYGVGATRGAAVKIRQSWIYPTSLGNIKWGVSAARNSVVTLDRVTIGGAVNGVDVYAGSFVEVINGSVIKQNTDRGINASTNSAVTVDGSSITDNVNTGVNGWANSSVNLDNVIVTGSTYGIDIGANSRVEVANSIVTTTADGGYAILTAKSGALRLNGGNTISATGLDGYAVNVIHASALWQQPKYGVDTITGLIEIGRDSIADMRGVNLIGGVVVYKDGAFHIRNHTGTSGVTMITGAIEIMQDSAMTASIWGADPFTIDGSITCLDDESSLYLPVDVTVTGATSCSGF